MKKTLFAVLILTLGTLQAAPEKLSSDYEWMSEQNYTTARTKTVGRSSRSVASLEVNEGLMSKEYKAFRAKFLSLKTPQELDHELAQLEVNYATYPDDLKLVAAVLIPLRAFRAFTYRVQPLASQEKITHSVMLSRILSFASFMRVNLPTDQWNAGFRYVTEPQGEEDLARIGSTEELQDYFGTKVFRALHASAKRIQALDLSRSTVVWDNKLLYGTASFQDSFKRYQLVGEAEKLALLAGFHGSLADIARFQAYDVKNYLPLSREIASLYGYDSVLSKVDGVTAKKVHDVFRQPKYQSLFTLRAFGQENMQTAHRHTKEAARLSVLAWQELKNRDSSDLQLIRGAGFMPFENEIDKSAEASERLISARSSVRSDITGEILTVDVPAFYSNPPKDLKAFLPVSFDQSGHSLSSEVPMKHGKAKKVSFRNYFHGRAIAWDASAYSTFLPEVKKGEDVAKAVKILNQSQGTAPVTGMINFFMLYN